MEPFSSLESSDSSSLPYSTGLATPMSSDSSLSLPGSESNAEQSGSTNASVSDGVYDDRTTIALAVPHGDDVLPLVLSYKQVQDCIPVPVGIYSQAAILKQEYLKHMTQDSLETQTSTITTSTELIAGFLQFSLGAGDSAHLVALFLLKYFAFKHIGTSDIHGVVSTLPVDNKAKAGILGAYFKARGTLCPYIKQTQPALLRAANNGSANLCALFGGQGLTKTFMNELRNLRDAYGIFLDHIIVTLSGKLKDWSLDSEQMTENGSPDIDVIRWLEDPQSCPVDMSVPSISFPIIGLIQICGYAVLCHIMGLTPGQFSSAFQSFAGHSQGLIVAAAISASRSWEDYDVNSATALRVLYSIGSRAQKSFPPLSLDAGVVTDSVENGEGHPSWMLSVRHLQHTTLQRVIDDLNGHLPEGLHVKLALLNGPENFVVAGPPYSLCALNKKLRPRKASLSSAPQSNIPYSKRKLDFITHFLPIGGPFHSDLFESVHDQVLEDIEGLELLSTSLRIPVYGGPSGDQLQSKSGNLLPSLVRMVTCEIVRWEQATEIPGCTHMLDFGPGQHLGIGSLVADNKRGRGVRVISALSLHESTPELGSSSDVFELRDSAIMMAPNWYNEFSPKLVRTSSHQTFIDTRLSRLLGVPPLIVAGMTPTTQHWDFVSATMNAGYHIELAGGGHHSEAAMEAAIRSIADNSPAGRGICINLLYLNPRAMAWQIPLIRKLRSEGVNIDGLTIGGGVPEPEVVVDWTDLNIRYLSFKPGSEQAIEAVLKIADAFPHFPIIVQWTGGRGGGHHSNEDFHRPILRSYSRLRHRQNTILVVGSGFGADDGSDAFPYLTGAWSEKLGFAAMPFDGILYGSRMMTVLEAHTAPAAKEIIAAASGTEDRRWEETMSGSLNSSSIISVKSEMGQPIHTVSTRGMRLWAELDRDIFSLPPSEQIKALIARKDNLIRRLNCDFQKVWFGVKDGVPVDLKEMTYSQVAERLLQLMFIPTSEKSIARWIHPSWQSLFSQFLQRTYTRFLGCEKSASSFVESNEWISTIATDPYASLFSVLRLHPLASQRLLSDEDEESFLMLCQQHGQKPVPFIPKLDENFETYFKKDSLWQSEDPSALIDGDIGRTCILQGPVAASFSNTANINRPVAEVLNGMNNGLTGMIAAKSYSDDVLSIPMVEFLGATWDNGPKNTAVPLGVIAKNDGDSLVYFIPPNPDMDLPPIGTWMKLMAGPLLSWRYAAIMSEQVVQGCRVCPNPVRRALMPRHGYRFQIDSPGSLELEAITVIDGQKRVAARIGLQAAKTKLITLDLFQHLTKTQKHASIQLLFEFDPHSGFAPLKEVLHGRNQRIRDFYRELWVGNGTSEHREDKTDILLTKYIGKEFRVTRELIRKFTDAVGGTKSAPEILDGKAIAPIDIAIVLGWTALTKPLVSEALNVDLSRLVHLSNSFKVVDSLLQEDDVVTSASRVTAVTQQANGTAIEIQCEILRGKEVVTMITSKFLIREPTLKLGTTWETKLLPPSQIHLKTPKDVAVFLSRGFISLEKPIDSSMLLGAHVVFKLQMVTKSSNKETDHRSIRITGCVSMIKEPVSERIGHVDYELTDGNGNPILRYLEKHSTPVDELVPLKNPLRLHQTRPKVHMGTTESYSHISGDYNPIHTSETFASFCGLPQIIRHGMCTSAAVQSVIQQWAGGADRVQAYEVSFLNMLPPEEDIEVELYHTGMKAGRKVISVRAFSCSSGCVVLEGAAEVQERRSAFLFTGQGSQKVGMGMDLAERSAAAKGVWDRADHYFSTLFGFFISNIVRDNPVEMTVHFGGQRGKKIRTNYMNLSACEGNGTRRSFFEEINHKTSSYTFSHPDGLLFTTEFAQPALTIMSMAQFADLSAQGLVPSHASFAGHSLGEYAALATMGELFTVEQLAATAWYRGLSMRRVVQFDANGRSPYAMLAINPSKVNARFTENHLHSLVTGIAQKTEELLEIVNFNIVKMQYVCAGSRLALSILLETLRTWTSPESFDIATHLQCQKTSYQSGSSIQLKRTHFAVPLEGVDVPFHSSFLRPGINDYRNFLLKTLKKEDIKYDKLIGRWIPNLTGRVFECSIRDIENVYLLTRSPVLGSLLERHIGA